MMHVLHLCCGSPGEWTMQHPLEVQQVLLLLLLGVVVVQGQRSVGAVTGETSKAAAAVVLSGGRARGECIGLV
jgi:hypothetical protein